MKIKAKLCMALCMGLMLAGAVMAPRAEARDYQIKCYTQAGTGWVCMVLYD